MNTERIVEGIIIGAVGGSAAGITISLIGYLYRLFLEQPMGSGLYFRLR